MANEVTIFTREIQENLHAQLEPVRMFAKQIPAESGAKTISIPTAGATSYDDVNVNNLTSAGAAVTYPVSASARADTEQTFNLVPHEFKPIVIKDYDEFVTNYSYRNSVMTDVYGLLGAWVMRTILNSFWSTTAAYEYATTGTDTYTNQWGDVVKNLTLDDVRNLAAKLDLQKVPRDGNRYLVLGPEMFSGLMQDMASVTYRDALTEAFKTGILPNVHGFQVVMMNEGGVATIGNAALRTPYTQGDAATDCNFGFALHKNFVGFAESGVRTFVKEGEPGYYGAVLSGAWYAGGTYLRANPIGCITVFEKNS